MKRNTIISFPCPKCGRTLKAPEETAGRSSRCVDCGAEVWVPKVAAIAEIAKAPEQKSADFNPYPVLLIIKAIAWIYCAVQLQKAWDGLSGSRQQILGQSGFGAADVAMAIFVAFSGYIWARLVTSICDACKDALSRKSPRL